MADLSINIDGDKKSEPRIVYIFGAIGEIEGTTALEVTQRVVELVQIDCHQPIQVLINSPGGSVIDGLSMLDAFDMSRQNGVKVVTRCQGQAASMAADILVLAGDLRSISKNSLIMVHGDYSKELQFGDALDIESEVRARSIYQTRLLDLYVKKTKRNRDYWNAVFKDSRPVYFTPEEALESGLVDVVY